MWDYIKAVFDLQWRTANNLILLSSLARYSQEPRLKRIFEILWVLFEKISVFYSDWPKSRIWRTLGMLTTFLVDVIFTTLQKKSFGLKKSWIPCMGSKVPFCQNWKIAKMALLNPCMKFKKHLQKIIRSCPFFWCSWFKKNSV